MILKRIPTMQSTCKPTFQPSFRRRHFLRGSGAVASLLFAAFLLPIFHSNGAAMELPPGFRPLFNGNDLNDWSGRNAEFAREWSAKNGELVNQTDDAYAATTGEFGDVELQMEFKADTAAEGSIHMRGVSLIQIRGASPTAGQENPSADEQSTGLPLVHVSRPANEWYQVKVRQIGSRTWIWINNKPAVSDAIQLVNNDEAVPPAGPIGLAVNRGEIRWRGLSIRPIPPEESNAMLREQDSVGDFKPLFDGKTLDGWEGALESYAVEDDAIHSKGGGSIYTTKQYADFEVIFEFKLAPGANSGLAVRYPGSGVEGHAGMCEIQILDDSHPQYAQLDPRQYHGSIYGMIPAQRGYLRPPGQWNYQKVCVQGHRVDVKLNGTLIVSGDVSEVTDFMDNANHTGRLLKSGQFGFAGHGAGVSFRNIHIRELKNP